MENVRFEEEHGSLSTLSTPRGGLIGFLLRSGIASSVGQATMIISTVMVLSLIGTVVLFSMALSGEEIDTESTLIPVDAPGR